MLLSFEFENYKSFKNRTTFSMVPAPKQKGLDYSILSKEIGKKNYKSLCSAVIYGANASGKTNIIGAIQTFKSILLRGNIKNDYNAKSDNAADFLLDLIPYNSTQKKDVYFDIKYIYKELLFEYLIKLDLGGFLDKDYDRVVKEEKLFINEKDIFSRTELNLSLNKLNLKSFSEYLNINFVSKIDEADGFAKNSLIKTDLFLRNGFKTIISTKISDMIDDYFSNYLKTSYHTDAAQMTPEFKEPIFEDNMINEVAKYFGIISDKLVYVKPNKNPQEIPVLCSVVKGENYIPSQIFESYGTIRFINILPMLLFALSKGGTIIMDEFDSSIHPRVIINIINIFHDDSINKNNAQIIFNTHNPLYLNGNILRRDEIKFVEYDDEKRTSKHYSLSDFGTKGTSARKGKDYMNKYFINEYGAIKDIDFTDIFKKFLNGLHDKKNS